MRFGCCGNIEQAQEIKDAGFDFIEVVVQFVLCGDLSDEAWNPTAPDPAKLPLPMEAANCLLPPSLPIIGPARDMAALQEYTRRVARRAKQLGIKRFVFGSGGARKRPDGVDAETAAEHLAQFASMAGDVCAQYDVVMVIEHLNRKETNTINLLAEARDLCDRVSHPNVALFVHSYHFGLEGEGDAAVLDLGAQLRHVHVAEVIGRVQPGAKLPEAGTPFDFVDFFGLLRKIGYNERISVEATWSGTIAAEGPACVKFLHAAWDKAGWSGE